MNEHNNHERRISILEKCYEHLDGRITEMKDDLGRRIGRMEKNVDLARKENLYAIFLIPVATALIIYFLR